MILAPLREAERQAKLCISRGESGTSIDGVATEDASHRQGIF